MTDDTIKPVPPEPSFPAVADGEIGGLLVQTVNARDLHAFLGVGRDFTNWIRDRIGAYEFAEGVDFVRVEVSANSGENPGGRPRVDYAITIDMAKELGMVERNEQGLPDRSVVDRPGVEVMAPAGPLCFRPDALPAAVAWLAWSGPSG